MCESITTSRFKQNTPTRSIPQVDPKMGTTKQPECTSPRAEYNQNCIQRSRLTNTAPRPPNRACGRSIRTKSEGRPPMPEGYAALVHAEICLYQLSKLECVNTLWTLPSRIPLREIRRSHVLYASPPISMLRNLRALWSGTGDWRAPIRVGGLDSFSFASFSPAHCLGVRVQSSRRPEPPADERHAAPARNRGFEHHVFRPLEQWHDHHGCPCRATDRPNSGPCWVSRHRRHPNQRHHHATRHPRNLRVSPRDGASVAVLGASHIRLSMDASPVAGPPYAHSRDTSARRRLGERL